MHRLNALLIALALVLSIIIIFVFKINAYAQDDNSCQIVLNALADGIDHDTCQQIEQDNACYASDNLVATLRGAGLQFDNRNERVKIVDIRSLISREPTGAAIMYVETPDDPVKIIVFGDTSVSPTDGQVYTMHKTGGQLLCERTPSGMLVQTKTGETGQVVVNGVTIRLHSTAFITMDGVVLFDQDPRIRRRFGERNPTADLCSGFDSDCNFANCALNTRLVWGPFCREDRDTYIEPGLYRVTLYGGGTVEAGATDFNATNNLFAYGRQVLTLPDQYTFCYPGLQPGGTGFETMVRSLTADARVDRITLEFLGGDCNNPWTEPDGETSLMTVTNVEGSVEVSIPGQTVILQEGEWVTIVLVNNQPVAINQPNQGLAVLGSRAILWLTDDERGLAWINENRPPGGTDPRTTSSSPGGAPGSSLILSNAPLSNQILFFSSRNYEATADPGTLENVIDFIDHSLYRMNSDGSNQEPVIQPINAAFHQDDFAVSPDGIRIAKRYSIYDSGNTLVEQGVEIFDLSTGLSAKTALEDIYRVHEWSPNGRNLLITFRRQTGSQNVGGISYPLYEAIIASLDLVTRNITELFVDPEEWITFASWSPDGNRIAFTQHYELWIMNADGSAQTKLLGDARDVDWSPDGNWIAYEAGPTGDQDIWIIRPDGTNPRNLTQTQGLTEYGPSWSPDSNQIAFSQLNNATEQIAVYNLRTNQLIWITDNGRRNASPVWVGNTAGLTVENFGPSATAPATTDRPTVLDTTDEQLLAAMYGTDATYASLSIKVVRKDPYVQNGVDKLFVVTQITPQDDFSCRLCYPNVGAAVFAKVGDGWQMEAVSPDMGQFGMWGEIYSGVLTEIGDGNYGMLFSTYFGGGAMSFFSDGEALMYPIGDTIEFIFRGATAMSNTAFCEEVEAECYDWTAEIEFVSGPNPKFNDIRLRSTGTRPTESGNRIESADGEKLYRFDGTAYVPVADALPAPVVNNAIGLNGDFVNVVQLLMAAAAQRDRPVLETLFAGRLIWAAPYGIEPGNLTVERSKQALGALLNAITANEMICEGYRLDGGDTSVILVAGLQIDWTDVFGWETMDAATAKVLLNFALVDGAWQFFGYSPIPDVLLDSFQGLIDCPAAGSTVPSVDGAAQSAAAVAGQTPTPANLPTSTRSSSPAPTATPPPVQLRIITNDLNVREGPGTSYERIGQLNAGQNVTIISRNPDGSWWNVCCVNGRSGWVINDPDYVSIEGNSLDVQPSQAATLVPAAVPSPVPIPTVAPAALGNNCSVGTDPLFNSLWQRHRALIGCPRAGRTTIQTIAEELFQSGHMFWRKDTDEVYVIYDRDKASGANLLEGQWTTNPLWKWDGSDLEGIGLAPPSGLVEPLRGFGWVWRKYLGRENGQLGWALDREYGFEGVAQAQIFEQGVMFKGSDAKVYLLLNNHQFFAQ